jgi:hypothetical protein
MTYSFARPCLIGYPSSSVRARKGIGVEKDGVIRPASGLIIKQMAPNSCALGAMEQGGQTPLSMSLTSAIKAIAPCWHLNCHPLLCDSGGGWRWRRSNEKYRQGALHTIMWWCAFERENGILEVLEGPPIFYFTTSQHTYTISI